MSRLLKNKSSVFLFLFLIAFVCLYLFKFTNIPFVRVDESWLTQASYTLASKGFFGSEMLTGLFGAEKSCHINPPFYYLLLALVFKVFGFGLLQGRLLSLILSFIGIIVFYKILEKVNNANSRTTIWLSVFLLLSTPLFFIFSKTIRPEASVFLFTLISYYGLLNLNSKKWVIISGIAACLSLMSNVSGSFMFLYGVIVLLIKNKENLKYYLIAFFITASPYFLWIANNWNDFYGQVVFMRGNEVDSLATKIFFLSQFLLDFPKVTITLVYLIIMITIGFFANKERVFNRDYLIWYLLPIICFFVQQVITTHPGSMYTMVVLPFIYLNIIYFRNVKYIQLISVVLIIVNLGGITMYIHKYLEYDYKKYSDKIVSVIPKGSKVLGPISLYIGLSNEFSFISYPAITIPSQKDLEEVVSKYNLEYIIIDECFDYKEDWSKELMDKTPIIINSSDYGSEGKRRNNIVKVYKI